MYIYIHRQTHTPAYTGTHTHARARTHTHTQSQTYRDACLYKPEVYIQELDFDTAISQIRSTKLVQNHRKLSFLDYMLTLRLRLLLCSASQNSNVHYVFNDTTNTYLETLWQEENSSTCQKNLLCNDGTTFCEVRL